MPHAPGGARKAATRMPRIETHRRDRRPPLLDPIRRPGAGPNRKRSLRIEELEDRTLLASASPRPLAVPLGGGSTSPVGLTPAQVSRAYGFNAVAFKGGIVGDGTGQTIAIVDAYANPNIVADLARFNAAFNLPAANLEIKVVGGPVPNAPGPSQTDAPWGQEIALDVEWAHALAPGASILLVETPGTDQGLIDGVIYARSRPEVSVISMSWIEASILNDAIFTTPAGHRGITYIAATGDDGSQAGYPAASPNVLAVGGTEFATPLNSTGDYPAAGEVAWKGSSGGVVAIEPQLPAQRLAVGNLGGRATPDVAFDAHSSLAVYDSYDYGNTPWVAVFGTSIGAPAWSSLVAIADQGLALNGLSSLDGPTKTLPALYGIARSGNLASGFNDITSGANQLKQAGPGYDLVTGLGTPKAPYIAATLSGNVDTLALITPGPQAVIASPTPNFAWTTVPGATGYVLTVTNVETGQVAFSQSGLISTSYTPTAAQSLAAGHSFNWTVNAVTAGGAVAPNAPYTQTFAVLSTPNLSSPSGLADTGTPAFQWSASPGAAGYNLQIVDTNTGETVVSTQVTTNSYTPSSPLSNLHTYEWSVSAFSTATYLGIPFTTPPSGAVYFTVSVPQAPTPLSPLDQAAALPPSATLQWTPVPGAVSYTVTLSNVLYGTSVTEVTGTSWTTPSLPGLNSSANKYTWYVQANFRLGVTTTAGPTSAHRTFYLNDVLQPTLLSPAPSAIVTTAHPTLAWSEVPGPSVYYILSLLDVTTSSSLIVELQIPPGSSYLSGSTYFFPINFPLSNTHIYEWSVSDGFGSVGPTNVFTVDIPGASAQLLPAPTPIGPDGVISTDSPTFTWTPVPGAVGYVLFYSRNQQTPDWLPFVTATNSATPVLDAPIDTDYIWWVEAFDAKGNVGSPSRRADFIGSVPRLSRFAAPTGLTPSGVVTSTNSPIFDWDPVPGASVYPLTVVDETTGELVIESYEVINGFDRTFYIPTTSEIGTPLVGGHQYRWYVSAGGDDGHHLYGQVASATFTYSPPATATPQPTNPEPNATVTTTTPTFQWSAVPGAVGYLIYVSDPNIALLSDGFLLTAARVSATSFTPPDPLLDAHTYYWQVSAIVLLNGEEVSGPTLPPSSFTVSAPGTPSLVAQGGSGTLGTPTPTLSWTPVDGASGYNLYLTNVTTGAAIFNGLPLVATSFAVNAPLNNGDTFRWYVTAFDDGGNVGLGASPLTFDVSFAPGGLPTPTLLSPLDTGKVKAASPVFQWTPVPNAVGYSVTITDKTTGKAVANNLAVRGTSYVPSPPLPADDTYSWYVRAIYGNGTVGPKPSGFTFQVVPSTDLSGPPTLLSPIGSAGASPVFRWSAVANAVAYLVEIDGINGKGATFYPVNPTTVSGTSFTPPAPLPRGFTYTWQVAAFDASGQETRFSSPGTFRVPASSTGNDFDGDGKSDFGVFQPSTSTFFFNQTKAGTKAVAFGQGTKAGGNPVPFAGDFDGDGRTDFGVFQPSTSTFYFNQTTAGTKAVPFGQGTNGGGNPVPFVGDFDGDGKADFGVFQPSTSTFYFKQSTAGTKAVAFGQGKLAGGNPVPFVGDFDGDGKSDFGVFQPSTSTFSFNRSTAGTRTVAFGQGTKGGGNPVPFVGDFDGDGKSDFGVFQPSTSTFYFNQTTAGTRAVPFGQGRNAGGNPTPIVGDFDGDGRSDFGVFQPSTSTFSFNQSSAGTKSVAFGQGQNGGGNPLPITGPVSVGTAPTGTGTVQVRAARRRPSILAGHPIALARATPGAAHKRPSTSPADRP